MLMVRGENTNMTDKELKENNPVNSDVGIKEKVMSFNSVRELYIVKYKDYIT